MGVLLGKQARLPVRLIMIRVSEKVAEQRRKRIRERAQDHSTRPSEELLYLAGWAIVVSNVPRARLSLPEAQVLLRLRWQIEVTFEEGRAHLGIETQRPWSDRAIERSAPLLFGLYSLVTLFGRALLPDGQIPVTRAGLVSQAHRHLS